MQHMVTYISILAELPLFTDRLLQYLNYLDSCHHYDLTVRLR